jgi:hypothetical protein
MNHSNKGSIVWILLVCLFLFQGEYSYAINYNFADRTFLQEIEEAGGRVMMDYTAVYIPSQDKTYYECMVWDTKTGVSKLYYYNYTDKNFVAYEDNVQLPVTPLGGQVEGKVMMDYTAVHIPSEDKTYYECMVWDTKTGLSKLYYYNFSDKKFVAYEDNVQLPKAPLGIDVKDGVMMDYTSVHVPSQDKTYYECMVWSLNTGVSKLYFYDYTEKKFIAYKDNVQLPPSPLGKRTTTPIMMDYTAVHVPAEDKTYYECMVWDTQTGDSKLYFYDYTEKKFIAYKDNVQLPTNPLGSSVEGQIMMDYTSVHVPSEDKTYYECMIWDTKTGVSKLYFYNYTDKKFVTYGDNVQLPTTPLGKKPIGNLQLDYTSVHVPSEDKTYYECMFWDQTTGVSKLYFYAYDTKKFKPYENNVQLPAKPVQLPQREEDDLDLDLELDDLDLDLDLENLELEDLDEDGSDGGDE